MLGLDPGLRTGCKVAVVDATGKLLETATIYPHQPRNEWQESLATLGRLVLQHGVELISIGNGTASRESDKLAMELVKLIAAKKPEQKLAKIVVSEAGASVYSASAFAAAEFPELDVSLRGAVSIARRLQDPLAELVRIDPKSIDVVIISHFHGDHINGLLKADKSLAFPNAEILVPAAEHQYYMDDGNMSRAPKGRIEGVFQNVRRVIQGDVLKRLRTYEMNKDVIPGVLTRIIVSDSNMVARR